MALDSFDALVAVERAGSSACEFRKCASSDLPAEGVLIDVRYSALNYKDALAVTGKGKVLRKLPLAPGIDLAGYVLDSPDARFPRGSQVLATGWGLGESSWGGYSQRNRVPSNWLVPVPKSFDLSQAMAIGTAGFTAMLCLAALEDYGLIPGQGPILVTGAGGGVGNMAIALLAAVGFSVTASTGRPYLEEYLRGLGASDVISRDELDRKSKPLESEHWGAAVDSVGGQTLATVLAQIRRGGAVAACGLAGGAELNTSVFPFILRGVALLGVESVTTPQERRIKLWKRIEQLLPTSLADRIGETIPLREVPAAAERVLAGEVRGRLVVDLHA